MDHGAVHADCWDNFHSSPTEYYPEHEARFHRELLDHPAWDSMIPLPLPEHLKATVP